MTIIAQASSKLTGMSLYKQITLQSICSNLREFLNNYINFNSQKCLYNNIKYHNINQACIMA